MPTYSSTTTSEPTQIPSDAERLRRREGKQRAHPSEAPAAAGPSSRQPLPPSPMSDNHLQLPNPKESQSQDRSRSRRSTKDDSMNGHTSSRSPGAGVGGGSSTSRSGTSTGGGAAGQPPRRTSSSRPSANVGVRRDRAYSLDGNPVSPPMPSEDETDDETWEKSVREANQFNGWHYLPLIFAVVPPVGAVIHGRAEAWSDSLVLIITAFYLYQIVRVPWELYYAARTRRILNTDAIDSTTSPDLLSRRRLLIAELNLYELVSLGLTVLAPFLGAMLLYWMRFALSDPDRFINPVSVRLFVLASGVKPWSHFFSLLKRRSLFLQEEVHYPNSTVVVLQSRIANLENALWEIRDAVATKTDLFALRDGVEAPLTSLQKALRRSERKEEYARLSSEERFVLLETRLSETLREVEISADMIEKMKDDNDKATPLHTFLRVVNHVMGGQSFPSEGGVTMSKGGKVQGRVEGSPEKPMLKWYERGPMFYAFLPLNVSNMALGYAGKGMENLVKKIESKEQRAMIGGPGVKVKVNGKGEEGLGEVLEEEEESEQEYGSGPVTDHTFATKMATVRGRAR